MNVTNNEGYTFTFDNNKNTIEVVDFCGIPRKVEHICLENRDISALREEFQKLASQPGRTFQVQYLKEKCAVVIGQYGLAGGTLVERTVAAVFGTAEIAAGASTIPVNPIAAAAMMGSGFKLAFWALTAKDEDLTFSEGMQQAAEGGACGATAAFVAPAAAALAAPLGPLAATAASGAAAGAAGGMASTTARAAIKGDPNVLNEITPERLFQDAFAGTVSLGAASWSADAFSNNAWIREAFNNPLLRESLSPEQIHLLAQASAGGVGGAAGGAAGRMAHNGYEALNYLNVIQGRVPADEEVKPRRMYLYMHEGNLRFKARTPNGVHDVMISEQFQALPAPADGNCLFHAISHQLNWLNLPAFSGPQLRLMALTFLQQNPNFYVNHNEFGEEINVYLQRMQRNDQWGGELEIFSLAAALDVSIYVDDRDHGTRVTYGNPRRHTLHILRFNNHYYTMISHGTRLQIEPLRNAMRRGGEFTEQQKNWLIEVGTKHGFTPVALSEGVQEAFLAGVGNGLIMGAASGVKTRSSTHRRIWDKQIVKKAIVNELDRSKFVKAFEQAMAKRAPTASQNRSISDALALKIYSKAQRQKGGSTAQIHYIKDKLKADHGIAKRNIIGIKRAYHSHDKKHNVTGRITKILLQNQLAEANLTMTPSGALLVGRRTQASVLSV